MATGEGRKTQASNGHVYAPRPNGGARAGRRCSPARTAPVRLCNDRVDAGA